MNKFILIRIIQFTDANKKNYFFVAIAKQEYMYKN